MLRLFSTSTASDSKVVYVAPTKSLCNERAADWKAKFGQLGLGWEVIELTGDSSNGMSNLKDVGSSRVIITTPEKWDSMVRQIFFLMRRQKKKIFSWRSSALFLDQEMVSITFI